MYKSVSHKHQIGDYQVNETISRTVNLTNIISILLHLCIKTYFQLWSYWSPTPFLMKRKSCRFNIISLRYRCRVTICRPYIRRFILHRPIWIALISGTLASNTSIWRDLDALNWICSVNHALKAYECWSFKKTSNSAIMVINFFCTKFDGL